MKIALLLPIVAISCIDSFEPEVGPLLEESCVNEDSNPDSQVSYSLDIVGNIFERETTGCLGCHAPTSPTPFGFDASGLDLSSYDSLRAGGTRTGSAIVVPMRPCESALLEKVKPGPSFGGRMPLNGGPFLSSQELQLIHDWIAEGASNN